VVAIFLLALASAGCRFPKKKAAADAGAGGEALTAPSALIDRPMYSLNYPKTWSLDTKDKDFDLDHEFSIDAPESCHVSFFLYDHAQDEKIHVDAQRSAMKERLFKRPPTETTFSTWGAYSGTGVALHGDMKPAGRGPIRIFAHSEKTRAMVVIEFCFDDELAKAKPGFDMVASSFKLK
jgi:hypothetical protein